jgi:hypothetical protein
MVQVIHLHNNLHAIFTFTFHLSLLTRYSMVVLYKLSLYQQTFRTLVLILNVVNAKSSLPTATITPLPVEIPLSRKCNRSVGHTLAQQFACYFYIYFSLIITYQIQYGCIVQIEFIPTNFQNTGI